MIPALRRPYTAMFMHKGLGNFEKKKSTQVCLKIKIKLESVLDQYKLKHTKSKTCQLLIMR